METNLVKAHEGAKILSVKNTIDKIGDDFNSLSAVQHQDILAELLKQIDKVDFRELAGLENDDEKLNKKHFLVCSIEEVLRIAKQNNWGLCKSNDFIYLYNGCFWSVLDNSELQTFLGAASEKMGINKYDARLYSFKEQLEKQFLSVAYLPKPQHRNEVVLINLKNGTYEIGINHQKLRAPKREDFLKHQLQFEFNPDATAPLFYEYLKKVQPDLDRQKVLAEYLGYLFIKNDKLKLEKALILYGTGANGKSVFFEIVNALLGPENVRSYSLQSLTNENGYFRAMLSNILVNYASEINGKLETSKFKQMVSGEPIEARLPYGEPFTLTNYAKFIFNCNELPRDVEHSSAFFRRFLIIPFDVTIPEEEQDKELSKKIIETELSGVFNWVFAGLTRLLMQKNFTYSKAAVNELEKYKKHSDSVQMFLEEENYERSTIDYKEFKELFALYRGYCHESGYYPVAKKTFGERLRNIGFMIEKKNYGLIVYAKKSSF